MALYSVWEWDKNAWAVYQTPESVSVGDDPKPPRPSTVSILGADPDTQVKALPSGARLLGYDPVCRGEVRAAHGAALGQVEGGGDALKYLLGFAAGVTVAVVAGDGENPKYAAGLAAGGALIWWLTR